MREIFDLQDRLRGAVFAQEHLKAHAEDWHALAAALWSVARTTLALSHFESSVLPRLAAGIQRTRTESTDDFPRLLRDSGEACLALYGFFQAVVVQQDALRLVWHLLVGSELPVTLESGWRRMRELRNLVAGHPIEKRDAGGAKRTTLGNVTRDGTLMIWVWNSNCAKLRRTAIPLTSVFDVYKEEVKRILGDLHSRVEAEHRYCPRKPAQPDCPDRAAR